MVIILIPFSFVNVIVLQLPSGQLQNYVRKIQQKLHAHTHTHAHTQTTQHNKKQQQRFVTDLAL
jgi:hypothetical protein